VELGQVGDALLGAADQRFGAVGMAEGARCPRMFA